MVQSHTDDEWAARIAELRAENDKHVREIAELADLVAFWAYQAKWYYAKAHKLGDYDALSPSRQRAIDAVFEQARVNENRERHSHAEAPRDIGGT